MDHATQFNNKVIELINFVICKIKDDRALMNELVTIRRQISVVGVFTDVVIIESFPYFYNLSDTITNRTKYDEMIKTGNIQAQYTKISGGLVLEDENPMLKLAECLRNYYLGLGSQDRNVIYADVVKLHDLCLEYKASTL